MKKLNTEEKEKIEANKEELINIILNLLDKGANYSIRTMIVDKSMKDLLTSVKKAFTNSDFKEIIKTAINGALKDGLESKNVKEKELENIDTMAEVAFSGGLPQFINLGIEIATAAKKYKNIFSNYIEEFVGRVKTYAMSTEFKRKVGRAVEKCLNKVEKFKELCALWYNAYDNLNVSDIENIANNIKQLKASVKFDGECLNQNDVIQNMTQIISKKKKRISKSRREVYDNLQEI